MHTHVPYTAVKVRCADQPSTETQSRGRGHFVRQNLCFSLGILSHTLRASTSTDTEGWYWFLHCSLESPGPALQGLPPGSAQRGAASLPVYNDPWGFFFSILF